MMRQTIRFPSACYKLHFFLATFAFLFVSFDLYFKCYLTGSQQLIVDINCFVFERKAWVQLQQLQLRLFSLWEMQLSTCTGTAMQYHTIQSNTIPCDTIQCHAIQYSAMQYHAIPCNTMQYKGGPSWVLLSPSKCALSSSPANLPTLSSAQLDIYIVNVQLCTVNFTIYNSKLFCTGLLQCNQALR